MPKAQAAGFLILAFLLPGCTGPAPSDGVDDGLACARGLDVPPAKPGRAIPLGSYAGPLYATSEKLGESAPIELLVEDMERNEVAAMIGYFFLEGAQKRSQMHGDEDLGYLLAALEQAPGRLLPYFSPGYEADKNRRLLGDELVDDYAEAHRTSSSIAGPELLAGIGELEIMDWQVPPDDARVRQLYEFAEENSLGVMLHILPGQTPALKRALTAHPDATFLLHMYPEDFDEERAALISAFGAHPNLFFTLDADHMLFDVDAHTGLLYKYEDEPFEDGAAGFLADYDRKAASMLQAARDRYGPLIEAHPDRVMWGTEMNPRYNFEPEVYDRVIDFSRQFLGAFPAAQDAVAYQNARLVYGPGVVCR